MPTLLRPFRLAFSVLLLLAASLPAQENIRFGAPERDTAAAFAKKEFEDHRIDRKQYSVSYNGKKNTPNWVSWNLRVKDIGPAERQDKWKHDPDLPDEFAKVPDRIYSKTGFERGHMCPSEDRTATQEDNDATFSFANAVPQSPRNNKNGWRMMEAYCQKLAKEGNDLYIVCGPQGRRGQGSRHVEFTNFLVRDELKITVPAVTWKVVLVLPNAKAAPSATTRTIAVVMPNDQSVTTDWGKYRCSMEHVEELTDYKFFPKIPKTVHDTLRERIDDVAVKKAKKKKTMEDKKDKKNAALSVPPWSTTGGPSLQKTRSLSCGASVAETSPTRQRGLSRA